MADQPDRQPPAPLTPDEELAWRALARAVLVIPRVLDGELLQAQGLSLTEYAVLVNLSEEPGRSHVGYRGGRDGPAHPAHHPGLAGSTVVRRLSEPARHSSRAPLVVLS